MGQRTVRINDGDSGTTQIDPAAPARETAVADRATRRAALMQMRDLWKASGGSTTDGVEYQKEMRADQDCRATRQVNDQKG